MLITTRYLLKHILVATAFVAVTLAMVVWLTQSLKILDLVANSDAPPWVLIQLVSLTLPRFLEIILPISLVASILFIYNKMIMDNELIVLRACGFDQMALAKPALMAAAGLTLLLLFLTTWLSPYCYSKMHLLRQDVKTKYSAFLLQDGVFNTFGDDMTVYLRSRNTAGELTGLLIHDARDKEKPPVTVTAKRGRILTDGNVPRIIVYDGMRQQPDLKTGAISKLFFSQYAIEINTTDSTAPARWREASERTLYELLNPDMSIKRDRMFQGYFFAEANHRLMAPFNALGFTMVALGCILLGPFNRRGQTRKVILAATLIVLLQSLHLTLASFDKKYLGALPLLYLLTFAPIGFGFYALRLKGEQQIMAILRKWNARQLPAGGASA